LDHYPYRWSIERWCNQYQRILLPGAESAKSRLAVPLIAEHEFPFVVGAPQGIGVGGLRGRSAGWTWSSASAPLDEAVPVQHVVLDGANGGRVRDAL
jgi:hypothetical protein